MKQTTLLSTLTIATFSLCFAAQADVVTDWNTAALDAVRGNRTPPPRASRNLAILHASIYDAVNGISRLPSPPANTTTTPTTAPTSTNRWNYDSSGSPTCTR